MVISSHTTIRTKVSTLNRIKVYAKDKESIDDTLNRILDFYALPIEESDKKTPKPSINFNMDEYLKDMCKILETIYNGDELLISKSLNILKEKKINELKT